MKIFGEFPKRSFSLPRLSPIELVTLLALLYSFMLVDMYKRPFFFLFKGNIDSILVLVNWLLPCFFARYLFSLYRVPRKKAHRFFLVYFTVLIVIFFGSRLEEVLSKSETGFDQSAQTEVQEEKNAAPQEGADGGEDAGFSNQAGENADSEGQLAKKKKSVIWIAANKFISDKRYLQYLNAAFFSILAGITFVWLRRDKNHTFKVLASELQGDLYVCRLMISWMACNALYSNLKAMVPLVRNVSFVDGKLDPLLYDAALYKMDCFLFLGNDPFKWLNSFNSPAFQTLMERSYFFFFFFILFGLTGTLLFGSIRLFEKTMASFIIGYLIGIIGYFAVPAVGPAFHAATYQIFEATQYDSLKQYLNGNYNAFVQFPLHARIMRLNGLAAFPSLHVAHSLLFMYYLWQVRKFMVCLLVIPFILLVISTVYLGWHYVVDLPAGILVAVITVYFVRKLYPEEKNKSQEEQTETEPVSDAPA